MGFLRTYNSVGVNSFYPIIAITAEGGIMPPPVQQDLFFLNTLPKIPDSIYKILPGYILEPNKIIVSNA